MDRDGSATGAVETVPLIMINVSIFVTGGRSRTAILIIIITNFYYQDEFIFSPCYGFTVNKTRMDTIHYFKTQISTIQTAKLNVKHGIQKMKNDVKCCN